VENRIIPPRKGMPIVFWNSHDSMLWQCCMRSIVQCTMVYRWEFNPVGWETLSNGWNVAQRKLGVHVDNCE
jgi:hypothetical protein